MKYCTKYHVFDDKNTKYTRWYFISTNDKAASTTPHHTTLPNCRIDDKSPVAFPEKSNGRHNTLVHTQHTVLGNKTHVYEYCCGYEKAGNF